MSGSPLRRRVGAGGMLVAYSVLISGETAGMLAGEASCLRGATRKMFDLNHSAWNGNSDAARAQTLDRRGFTSADLKLLQQTHQSGVASRGWGRAQFVANEFSQYLAIWDKASAERDRPILSIIRFGKTGTYALLADDKFIVTGDTLRAVLPTLTAEALSSATDPVMELAEA